MASFNYFEVGTTYITTKVWWNDKNDFNSLVLLENLVCVYLSKSIHRKWEKDIFTHKEVPTKIVLTPLR